MSAVRGLLGAVAGAAAAGVALRVRAVSRQRGVSVAQVVSDLPGLLAQDATRVADAVRGAAEDGRDAAKAAKIEFDEQVAAHARRNKGEHG